MSTRSLFAVVLLFVVGTALTVRWYVGGDQAFQQALPTVRSVHAQEPLEGSERDRRAVPATTHRSAGSGWTRCPTKKKAKTKPTRSRPASYSTATRSSGQAPLPLERILHEEEKAAAAIADPGHS